MADIDLPLNADKILFAETLVNYVFREYDDVYIEIIPEDKQDEVHNGFTTIVKDAVEFIEVLLQQEVETIFGKMEQDDDGLSEEKLLVYAADLRKKCFRQGFDADNFLNYCVHIAMLACKFHPTQAFDVQEAAVSCIMASFDNYDMFSGGWDALQNVSKKFQQAYFSMLTPSPRSDDYPEDFAIPKDAELGWIGKYNSDSSSTSSSEGNDDLNIDLRD